MEKEYEIVQLKATLGHRFTELSNAIDIVFEDTKNTNMLNKDLQKKVDKLEGLLDLSEKEITRLLTELDVFHQPQQPLQVQARSPLPPQQQQQPPNESPYNFEHVITENWVDCMDMEGNKNGNSSAEGGLLWDLVFRYVESIRT
jgi:hypothetical protein